MSARLTKALVRTLSSHNMLDDDNPATPGRLEKAVKRHSASGTDNVDSSVNLATTHRPARKGRTISVTSTDGAGVVNMAARVSGMKIDVSPSPVSAEETELPSPKHSRKGSGGMSASMIESLLIAPSRPKKMRAVTSEVSGSPGFQKEILLKGHGVSHESKPPATSDQRRSSGSRASHVGHSHGNLHSHSHGNLPTHAGPSTENHGHGVHNSIDASGAILKEQRALQHAVSQYHNDSIQMAERLEASVSVMYKKFKDDVEAVHSVPDMLRKRALTSVGGLLDKCGLDESSKSWIESQVDSAETCADALRVLIEACSFATQRIDFMQESALAKTPPTHDITMSKLNGFTRPSQNGTADDCDELAASTAALPSSRVILTERSVQDHLSAAHDSTKWSTVLSKRFSDEGDLSSPNVRRIPSDVCGPRNTVTTNSSAESVDEAMNVIMRSVGDSVPIQKMTGSVYKIGVRRFQVRLENGVAKVKKNGDMVTVESVIEQTMNKG